ncbi:hypothetical protein BGZ92_002805 [Podila epicladia]|nr:hypothetical protein BGZ92_002805 [Podila epicladia]
MVESSLKRKQALQLGKGLNYYLFGHALKEPQDESSSGNQEQLSIPKIEDANYFVQEGDDFQWGEVTQVIAKHFQQLDINDTGLVKG